MTNRMLAAVGAALAFVGASFAQLPDSIPLDAPPTVPAEAVAPSAPGSGPWVSVDYVLGRINGTNGVPPLLTTSPTGTPQTQAGVVGLDTTVLLGGPPNSRIGYNEDPRSGFRLQAGAPLGGYRNLSIEAGFLMLESQATLFSAASEGLPILARPYINTTNGTFQAALIAYPGLSAGTFDARLSSESFYTANLDLSETFYDNGTIRLESMLGYRYYRHGDAVRMRSVTTPLGAAFAVGTLITSSDDFSATNEFHGAEIGLRGRWNWEALTVTLMAKVAGGNIHRVVDIRGLQTVTVPGAATLVRPAGLLALSSNSGGHTSNDFTATPELAAALSWQATPQLRLHVGASMMLLINAASAGAQIDTRLNPALFPPATRDVNVGDRPAFRLAKTDVWVQTLQFGAELTW